LLAELASNEGRADIVSGTIAYTRPPWGLGWLVGGALLLESTALPRTHSFDTLRASLLVRRSDGMVEQRPLVELVPAAFAPLDAIAVFPASSMALGHQGLVLTQARWPYARGWVPNRFVEAWLRVAQ
jgi:hypothetical protein